MENSKMSSIHDIARIEEAQKSQHTKEKEQQLTLAQKSQEQIQDELRQFEHSIN